jgi:hypothetical protein
MKSFRTTWLALFFLFATSAAALADPPMGTWVGDHGSLTFTLSPDGNYVIPGQNGSVGTWGWQQTGPTGGILTFTYTTPTVGPSFTNRMYFSIEFMDAKTATLTDPTSGNHDTIRKQ